MNRRYLVSQLHIDDKSSKENMILKFVQRAYYSKDNNFESAFLSVHRGEDPELRKNFEHRLGSDYKYLFYFRGRPHLLRVSDTSIALEGLALDYERKYFFNEDIGDLRGPSEPFCYFDVISKGDK